MTEPRTVRLIVSPVTSAEQMIVVPSISPATISAVRPRRRVRLRRPSRSRIRWRSASDGDGAADDAERDGQRHSEVADRDAEHLLHQAAASTSVVGDDAVDHADDPVGRAADREVVRDDQQRQAALDVEPPQQRGDLLGVRAVEVAGRLVGPHDRRVVDQRAGDRHALALAAGELVGDVAAAVGQADQLERLVRTPARLGGGDAGDEQRQLDVLHRRQDRHQVVVLKDEAHPARAVVGAPAVGHRGQGDALDLDLAGVDRVETGEAVEQRGLAAAARPHHGDHLAAGQRQVDAAQRLDAHAAGVVGLAHGAGRDDRRFHARSFPPARARDIRVRPHVRSGLTTARPGGAGRARGVHWGVRREGSAARGDADGLSW